MTQDQIFANARLILPEEVIRGSLLVRDGVIAAIDCGTSVPKGALNCEGDYLGPGLIELHTDNLERHMRPRPKVDWPHKAAIVAHDSELAGTGITTVFDAIRVGSITSGGRTNYAKYARSMADDILGMHTAGVLKISHHLHLRAEICSETLAEELEEFGPEDRVGIVSMMDHTPGQRQFRDIGKYAEYMQGKHHMSRDEFDAYMQDLRDIHARYGAAHEAAAVAAAKRYGATLASHDDTTTAQVETSSAHEVRMAEFPTTREAAEACSAAAISVIMGGPNLVRGGSHSGNISAQELAESGNLDILSSDYAPSSLLMGAVILGDLWLDLARGIATVTRAPAEAVGLSDRGSIAQGLRADLIRFRRADSVAALRGTWSEGRRIA